jgi:hypothetical protein
MDLKITDRKAQFASWLLLCALCLLPTGCGSSKFPKTVPVSGRVTFQGKPLAGGTVAFLPVNGSEGQSSRPVAGEIGPDGGYQLSSFRKGDGAMPGQYHVTVESYSSIPTRSEPNKPYVRRIPQRYGKPAESGLSATIPADASGPLVFDFDVTK